MQHHYLSSFTPSLMSSETLEAIFVQREKLAEDLLAGIKESAMTKNKHYRLLVGMRGIGKTHTIALIYHRLQKEADLQDKLLIAWLKEEEWGISSWLDLQLRIFQALKNSYPKEYRSKIEAEVESMYVLSSDEATIRGENLIKEFVGEKTLLLLTENLDEIFKGLGDKGQKKLRAYLQNHNFITIVATSQSLFNGVTSKKSPFYGFFNPQRLDKLSLEEATSLLFKIAEFQEDAELTTFIRSPTGRDRIKAIHHLAGGNHRVYTIFSQFLTRDSLDDLVQPVMQTLDELTPYYQARMQWLSPQQRKIIELLCDRRGAVPVKEIAQRCFISHQTASSQLKDLLTKGYVTKETQGRESFYELQEPLMRICLEVKKQRGEPIKLFIDFLRIWYTVDELKERLMKLPSGCLEKQYVRKALIAKLDIELTNIIAKFTSVEPTDIGFDSVEQGFVDYSRQDYTSAISNFQKYLEINPENTKVISIIYKIYSKANKFKEGFQFLDNCLDSNSNLRKLYFDDIENIAEVVSLLFKKKQNRNTWQERLHTLIEFYEKYQVIYIITIGITVNIRNLLLKTVSNQTAQTWLKSWQQVGKDKPELEVLLRFLKTAVEYKETKGDRKVLLQLPKEERDLFETLLQDVPE